MFSAGPATVLAGVWARGTCGASNVAHMNDDGAKSYLRASGLLAECLRPAQPETISQTVSAPFGHGS